MYFFEPIRRLDADLMIEWHVGVISESAPRLTTEGKEILCKLAIASNDRLKLRAAHMT